MLKLVQHYSWSCIKSLMYRPTYIIDNEYHHLGDITFVISKLWTSDWCIYIPVIRAWYTVILQGAQELRTNNETNLDRHEKQVTDTNLQLNTKTQGWGCIREATFFEHLKAKNSCFLLSKTRKMKQSFLPSSLFDPFYCFPALNMIQKLITLNNNYPSDWKTLIHIHAENLLNYFSVHINKYSLETSSWR